MVVAFTLFGVSLFLIPVVCSLSHAVTSRWRRRSRCWSVGSTDRTNKVYRRQGGTELSRCKQVNASHSAANIGSETLHARAHDFGTPLVLPVEELDRALPVFFFRVRFCGLPCDSVLGVSRFHSRWTTSRLGMTIGLLFTYSSSVLKLSACLLLIYRCFPSGREDFTRIYLSFVCVGYAVVLNAKCFFLP